MPVLQEGDTLPPTLLVDQLGRTFELGASPGHVTIVSFVYTRCRDARMCTVVAGKFAWLQHALHGAPIRLITITLDPGYDTPAVLRRYGAAFGADPARWTLATGDAAAIADVAGRLGVTADRTGSGLIVHNEAAIVLDERGQVTRIVDGAAWLPSDVLADALAVSGAHADPLVRVRMFLSSSASALCGGGRGGFTVLAQLALFGAAVAAFGIVARRAFRQPGAAVQRGTLVQTVNAEATVNPQNLIAAGTHVSGTISELDVALNSAVRTRQIIP